MIGTAFHVLSSPALVAAMALFAALTALEAIIPRERSAHQTFAHGAKNLAIGMVNRVIVLPMVAVPLTHVAIAHGMFERASWLRTPWGLVFDLLVLDLTVYSTHVLAHRVPVLWRFHRVHHLDEHLDASTGFRQHFAEKVLILPVKLAALLVFAIPVQNLIVFETVTLLFASFHHANIRLPRSVDRILGKVLTVPSFHAVHHGRRQVHTDSNYGATLSIWDRLFGTVSIEERPPQFEVGLDDHSDSGFVDLVVKPFVSDLRPSRGLPAPALD